MVRLLHPLLLRHHLGLRPLLLSSVARVVDEEGGMQVESRGRLGPLSDQLQQWKQDLERDKETGELAEGPKLAVCPALTIHRTTPQDWSSRTVPWAVTVEKRVCEALFLTAALGSAQRSLRQANSSSHRRFASWGAGL